MPAMDRTNYPGGVFQQFLVEPPEGAGRHADAKGKYPLFDFAMIAV